MQCAACSCTTNIPDFATKRCLKCTHLHRAFKETLFKGSGVKKVPESPKIQKIDSDSLYILTPEEVAPSLKNDLYLNIDDLVLPEQKKIPSLPLSISTELSATKDQKLSQNTLLRDWGGEFRAFSEKLAKKENSKENMDELLKGYASVAQQFVDSAIMCAKIIISEVCLPVEQKSLKPVDMGGIAGGTKYIYQNILFKFALDSILFEKNRQPFWMYGGYEGPNDKAGFFVCIVSYN
jgi:hypothetical protein